ncbi:MAG: hypothetical protein M3441_15870 [Chloroflexota bacterium]|nr:hypothetical protein [Chloroflexota bacterium]
MKRSQILAILLLTSLLFSIQLRAPGTALACSCASYSPQSQYEGADVVFSGRVVNLETQKATRLEDGMGYTKNTYTFEVTTNWKGTTSPVVKAYYTSDFTTPQGFILYNSCAPGSGFITGKEYLVYASSTSGDPILLAHYGGCSGTRAVELAEEDLTFLEGVTRISRPRTGDSTQLTILVLTAAGMALAGGVAARRYLSK